MARPYSRGTCPLEDLVSVGIESFLNALKTYEEKFGTRVATYAAWWIRASLQDYVRNNSHLMKMPSSSEKKKLYSWLRRTKARLGILGEQLSEHDAQRIATALGVNPSAVLEMHMLLLNPVSIDTPIGDEGGAELIDTLVDETTLSPSESAEISIDQEHRKKALQAGLLELDTRERRILLARQLSEDPSTLGDLGTELGISKERVRQIEMIALKKLSAASRKHLETRTNDLPKIVG